jgi:hypothetical protein
MILLGCFSGSLTAFESCIFKVHEHNMMTLPRCTMTTTVCTIFVNEAVCL